MALKRMQVFICWEHFDGRASEPQQVSMLETVLSVRAELDRVTRSSHRSLACPVGWIASTVDCTVQAMATEWLLVAGRDPTRGSMTSVAKINEQSIERA